MQIRQVRLWVWPQPEVGYLDCKMLNDRADDMRKAVLGALRAWQAWKTHHVQLHDVQAKWRSMRVGRMLAEEARLILKEWRAVRRAAAEMTDIYLDQLVRSKI